MGRQLTWAWEQLAADTARDPAVKALLKREKVEDWYMVQPMQRGLNPLSVNPEYEAWYLDFYEHADYDAFWKDPMVNWSEHYTETADIPMMQIGGVDDIFLAGSFQNYVALSKLKHSPQRLLVGPWTHHGTRDPTLAMSRSARVGDRGLRHHLPPPVVRAFSQARIHRDGVRHADPPLHHGDR